jgi:hypothetical protein
MSCFFDIACMRETAVVDVDKNLSLAEARNPIQEWVTALASSVMEWECDASINDGRFNDYVVKYELSFRKW